MKNSHTDTSNFYEPPKADLANHQLNQSSIILASRGMRLVSALIDSVIGIVLSIPIWLSTDIIENIKSGQQLSLSLLAISMVYGFVAFVVIHGYLLHKYGQTVGKRITGIYIAQYDSSKKASLFDILVKRALPINLLAAIPVVGNVLILIDALFIFKKNRRCIHDYIANTHVLEVGSK